MHETQPKSQSVTLLEYLDTISRSGLDQLDPSSQKLLNQQIQENFITDNQENLQGLINLAQETTNTAPAISKHIFESLTIGHLRHLLNTQAEPKEIYHFLSNCPYQSENYHPLTDSSKPIIRMLKSKYPIIATSFEHNPKNDPYVHIAVIKGISARLSSTQKAELIKQSFVELELLELDNKPHEQHEIDAAKGRVIELLIQCRKDHPKYLTAATKLSEQIVGRKWRLVSQQRLISAWVKEGQPAEARAILQKILQEYPQARPDLL